MAKKKNKTRAIVAGYVEKVSAQIFDRYQKEITDIKAMLDSAPL